MTVRRWDARNGKEVGKPMKKSAGQAGLILDLLTSTDCKLIVLGSHTSLQ